MFVFELILCTGVDIEMAELIHSTWVGSSKPSLVMWVATMQFNIHAVC